MLTAPAKTLDFETPIPDVEGHDPLFLKQAEPIVKALKQCSVPELKQALNVSDALAELNHERFTRWSKAHGATNARPALFAYKGDIFKQLDLAHYAGEEREYLHDHLRIVSGLYGYLRALDRMRPYRLEMKLSLDAGGIGSLQRYWKPVLTKALAEECEHENTPFVLNLASKEYADAFDFGALPCPVIDVTFLQQRNGETKTFGLLAKRARGMMIDFAAKRKAKTIDDIAAFSEGGYRLSDRSAKSLTFVLSE